MNIKISLLSSVPIYLQIVEKIKKEIINNKLTEYQLPSIRALAKELEVGIITVKKAYEQLSAENYIYSRSGKGYFVSKIDFEQVHENTKKELNVELTNLLNEYLQRNITKEEIKEIFNEAIGG